MPPLQDHDRLVSTARLNEMKRELSGAGEMVHELLGCEFGHGRIVHRDDSAPCQEAAVQIVALHDGPREMHFKLCARHRDLILSETREVVCDQVEASCVCHKPFGHDGPHVCDCGGRWTFNEDGEFVAVRLPGIFGRFE